MVDMRYIGAFLCPMCSLDAVSTKSCHVIWSANAHRRACIYVVLRSNQRILNQDLPCVRVCVYAGHRIQVLSSFSTLHSSKVAWSFYKASFTQVPSNYLVLLLLPPERTINKIVNGSTENTKTLMEIGSKDKHIMYWRMTPECMSCSVFH